MDLGSVFTNDLPDVIHSHEGPLSFKDPNMQCSSCGGLVNFVDDATYTYACKDPAELSEKLTSQYENISSYMASNKLVINADKTHLLVMGTGKPAMNRRRQEVHLQAGDHRIEPTPTEKLLGCNIHHNLKWKEHLQSNKKSVTSQLTSRVNALRKMSVNATFKTRLMAANGAFMSILTYLIPLWGGTEGYLLKSLQVLQNRAARSVTKLSWYTPTRQLLSQCNWLSINQLIFYQTVLQVHRVVKSGSPLYLSDRLDTEHVYNTRQAAGGCVRWLGENSGELSLLQTSFLGRASKMYNDIPAKTRRLESLPTFKKELKTWIKIHIKL